MTSTPPLAEIRDAIRAAYDGGHPEVGREIDDRYGLALCCRCAEADMLPEHTRYLGIPGYCRACSETGAEAMGKLTAAIVGKAFGATPQEGAAVGALVRRFLGPRDFPGRRRSQ